MADHSLLPGVDVHIATDLVPALGPLHFCLETPNEEHLAEEPFQLLRGEAPPLDQAHPQSHGLDSSSIEPAV